MKMSFEERFRKKMLKIGKKNKFCRICIIPVMIVGMFFLHGASYCRGNGKRFAMVAMTFLFFVVYSSFSFPMFISGDGDNNGLNPVSDEAANIALAEEAEINLEDIELLDDDEILAESETGIETVHGMEIVERYSASEILELNQPSISSDAPSEEMPADYKFSRGDWRLLLVNKQHSIPDGYEEQVPLGKIMTMKGVMCCDERIIDDLLNMIQKAKDDGVTLQICSPYRDLEYQKILFNSKVNKYMKRGLSYMEAYQFASQAVTVPNASEHQLGLALDIVSDTYINLDEGFADTDAGRWLAENSYKYGFILRYPLGKEYITGIEYEPWHFRYVGIEAATVITEQGITLEEFWDMEQFWEEL